MKKLLLIFLILLSCSKGSEATYSIIIYGTNICGYTTALRDECTKNNIAFTYCNIEIVSCFNSLSDVVNEFNLATNNYVDLPVVEITVNGKSYGLVRPSIDKIKQLIGLTSSLIAKNSDIIMYPNPATDIIHINKVISFIEIFDVAGSRVLYSREQVVNISSLLKGVYIVKVHTNSEVVILKLIKQ